MVTIPTSHDLCTAFCQVLNQWLDAKTLAEINRRNSTPGYRDSCASHDFCDANQAMLEALMTFGLGFEHEHIDLINEAWTLAQSRRFRSDP